MRLAKEVIITALFLSLYTPLSIALWYFTGQATNLIIVMLIGLSIITAYLYVQIARYKLRRRRRRTHIAIEEEPDEEIKPEEREFDIDNLEGFRTLFSQDKHGGEAL